MKTLNDLFEDTIKDIFNSEEQIVRTLPELHKRAKGERLREALANHLVQTKEHVRRIEQIAEKLDFKPTGKVCAGTQGIIKEGQEALENFEDTLAGDAAIIAAAQKVEHYEISNYGTVIAWAEELDLDAECIDLLERTLQEEEETDDLLSTISEEEAIPQSNGTLANA